MSLPPAQPAYILRGHAAHIHAANFIRSNSRLVTGDAEGWIVVWSLAIKRPVAVWRAHEGAILGVRSWGNRKLITHGKDNKLILWKFSEADEPSLSTVLPVDTPSSPRPQPWLLHILNVNTMNFCSFSQCPPKPTPTAPATKLESPPEDELLVAVPNTMGSETVDIFHLPSTTRLHTVPAPVKGGMVMAVAILYHPITHALTILAGYESGHTAISSLSPSGTWQTLYLSLAHTQPVLSLDISPKSEYFLTSSADALVVKHPIPGPGDVRVGSGVVESMPLKTLQTKHAGQQGLRIRDDGKVFATAGWDSRVRVYAGKGMRELAVLKWHKEGCYCVAFADVVVDEENEEKRKQMEAGNEVAMREKRLTVKDERIRKAESAHWLAAGSKDGKISLWDIY